MDDLLIYQIGSDHYFVVVNAANNDKDWAWVNGVLRGEVMIDPRRPWVRWQAPEGAVVLRDLRQPEAGADMRNELAIQGPKSKDILLALGGAAEDQAKVRGLPWSGITRVVLGGFDLIVSRTGYTGERVAYEVFVHPDQIVALWKKLLEIGEPMGLKPCGLAARDSLRIEAGLPLYGHEMAGPLNLTMGEAGFGTYPKAYKPFFVGREAYLDLEAKRDASVVRFRVQERGNRCRSRSIRLSMIGAEWWDASRAAASIRRAICLDRPICARLTSSRERSSTCWSLPAASQNPTQPWRWVTG